MRGRVGILAPDLQAALDEVAAAEREGVTIQSSPEALKLQSAGLIEMRVQSWHPEVGPVWERATLTPAGRAVYETRRPSHAEAVSGFISSYVTPSGPVRSVALALSLSLEFVVTVVTGLVEAASGSWWQLPVILGGWLCFLLGVRRQADQLAGVELRGELERLVPKALRREEWDA